MEPRALLDAGDLTGARKALAEQVRKSPADPKLRVFLFQLYCVAGDWTRALTQLRVCGEMDEATAPMVRTYREAIGCEMLREKVFAGESLPHVMGEPPEWLAPLIEALRVLARGEPQAAASLREQAYATAPASPGTAAVEGAEGESAFAWIADADTRLGPVLEVIVNGRYFWAPFSTVAGIEIEAPEDLRDRVWLPATVTFVGSAPMPALIPTRYPGAAGAEADGLRLSRETRWHDLGHDAWVGSGQRLLATDGADIALMDLRRLTLAPAAAAEPAAADEPADG